MATKSFAQQYLQFSRFATYAWIVAIIAGNSVIADGFDVRPCPDECSCTRDNSELSIVCRSSVAPNTSIGIQIEELLRLFVNATNTTSFSDDADQITSLVINGSSIVDVPPSVCRLRHLSNLVLDRNRIRRLPDNCFAHMSRLARLSITYNVIKELQDGLFDGLVKLKSIDLGNNEISSIGLRVFTGTSPPLRSLKQVSIGGNRLRTIDSWPFYLGSIAGSKASRVSVDLSFNSIERATNDAGMTLGCRRRVLSYLDLNLKRNNFRHIKDMVSGLGIGNITDLLCAVGLIDMRSPTVRVTLVHNFLTCDCVDFEYIRTGIFFGHAHLFDQVFCSNFRNLQMMLLYSVDLNELVCDVTERCPIGCRCVYRPANSTMHVVCSVSNPIGLPTELPPLPKSTVRYKIEIWNISVIDGREYFAKTSILDVSNSGLERISAAAWKQLVMLDGIRQVLLNGNRLRTLPQIIDLVSVNASSRRIIHLDMNPWSCTCNDSWMAAWLTVVEERLANQNGILCDYPSRLRGRNVLTISEYDFCVDPASGYTFVTEILSSTIAFVATTLLAVALIVYRWRLKMFVRWKLHPFDRDECTGEAMEYDVFLCCSSEDHAEHGKPMVERLESSGYAVYYHLRDFIPGEIITENIAHAILHSKRTMCLLSRHFVNSPSCMHEFEAAYHHYITVVRKKRLVVVMMLDSPATAINDDNGDSLGSESLRQYLRQYTYIDYTADDWFDRLLYALPLNGMLQQQQQNVLQDGDDEDERAALIMTEQRLLVPNLVE